MMRKKERINRFSSCSKFLLLRDGKETSDRCCARERAEKGESGGRGEEEEVIVRKGGVELLGGGALEKADAQLRQPFHQNFPSLYKPPNRSTRCQRLSTGTGTVFPYDVVSSHFFLPRRLSSWARFPCCSILACSSGEPAGPPLPPEM
ncbi:hypothetical protein R1flu_006000 [Riccia fluitans]|uniref:Uncharacterized protein n=1 Tax=Riccia fluitans TaxID=41844 RepID=A0ABD1YVD4_9MARC